MSVNVIKVSTKRIKSDAETIDKLSESVPTMMKDLEDSMGKLSACWEGPAWGVYQQTVAGYMQSLTEIYETMKRYSADIQQSAQDYQRAEQDVCSKIDQVIMI